MLKYLVTITEDLVPTMIMTSLLLAFFHMEHDRRGKISQLIGVGAGLAASVCMAFAKNLTSKIATNRWNLYIFYVGIIASLILIICSFLAMRMKSGKSIWKLLTYISGAVLTADVIFYEVPDVLAYPFNFDTSQKGILSVEFLVRLIGYLLGLVLVFVYAVYLYKTALALGNISLTLICLDLVILTNGFRFFGLILSKWLARPKWLKWPRFVSADHPWAFPYAKFVANNLLLFVVLMSVFALIIPVVLFFRNIKMTQPYDNSAQRRKLIATGRRRRRWAYVSVICFVLCALNLTVVKAYLNRAVVLSEPEVYEVQGDQVVIPVDQLQDGHLHRFEYKTENGVNVRWIIIKKPGSNAYGVGFDACEVCGIAGYFERDGQVVCKRCDVVMNINTIGFKGGCNPIPLAYRMDSGNIVIELADIIAGESEFE